VTRPGTADARRRRPAREPYDSPRYYHVAFELNRRAETDFLEACFARFARRRVRRVVDLACGTGHHALRLAARGYRVTALDLSAPSIEFLAREAARRRLRVEAAIGDMTAFRLPRPADAVICMQDSQGHLLDNEALLAHFRAVGANLGRGGLFVFDRLIPNGWATPNARWAWTRRRDGITVRTTFRTLERYDPVRQTCDELMRFDITREDGSREVVRQRHTTRIVFPQELRTLVALAGGFELAGWFSNFSLARPLERARGPLMMITVLRKT
jgi:SAM-dependent methyltransferase